MCKDSATAIINKKQNVAEAVNERWINTFGGYVFDSNQTFIVRPPRTDFVTMSAVLQTANIHQVLIEIFFSKLSQSMERNGS